MSDHIHRSINEPLRGELDFFERWRGPDQGLITCWETGRKLSQKDPDLAIRARNGELPMSGWKGGVEKKVNKRKYGSLRYLAEWQGLRGDDLDIKLSEEKEIICSRTNMKVIFTGDLSKLSEP